MKYINNKKSYNLIITITIIIILLLIIYFYGSNFLYSNSIDKFEVFNTLNLNNLPITDNLIAVYTSDSFLKNQWKDISGNNNHATISGNVDLIDNYLVGTIDSSIEFPTTILPEEYTLITIAKYNGNNKGRIFSGIGSNWLSGFSDARVGVAYHDGWLTISNNVPNDWVLSTDQNTMYRANTYNFTTGYGNSTTNLSVNSENDDYLSRSDWAIACILVYNTKLSLEQIQSVENYLLSVYNNLLNIQTNDNSIVYTDNIVELPTLIYQNVYTETKNNKLELSSNVFQNINKYIDINKTSDILNIQTNDDIELVMVGAKFRLKVNLPLVSPLIPGLNFDSENGINPNFFYLGIEELNSNCKVESESECKNLYIDNKTCNNKILSENIDDSYRLVLIPGIYAIDDDKKFNIDFTLIKIDGLIYLMNVNTKYLPQIYKSDIFYNINATVRNNNNSNAFYIYQESTNILCNKEEDKITRDDKMFNITCASVIDPKLYLFTTTDTDTSSPVSFTINKNKTIRINLDKYDIYGNLENSYTLSSCTYNTGEYNLDNFPSENNSELDPQMISDEMIKEKMSLKNIEETTKNSNNYLLNLVCINLSDSNDYKLSYLDFIVELIEHSNKNNSDAKI
jgi:hypothetical protein